MPRFLWNHRFEWIIVFYGVVKYILYLKTIIYFCIQKNNFKQNSNHNIIGILYNFKLKIEPSKSFQYNELLL